MVSTAEHGNWLGLVLGLLRFGVAATPGNPWQDIVQSARFDARFGSVCLLQSGVTTFFGSLEPERLLKQQYSGDWPVTGLISLRFWGSGGCLLARTVAKNTCSADPLELGVLYQTPP